jgi:hypothetical protein
LQDVAEVVEHDANVLGVGFHAVKPLERAHMYTHKHPTPHTNEFHIQVKAEDMAASHCQRWNTPVRT